MAVTSHNLSVWTFLDYRAFLKEFYLAKKRERANFSYRIFSQKTGIQSPNYLKLIIDGERNLTVPHARRVARYCALDGEGVSYFIALVRWNQSKNEEEKDLCWEQLLQLRKQIPSQRLSSSYLSILTQWQTVALMEMIRLNDFSPDPAWIQQRFRGELSATQIETALKELEDVGLIEKTSSGFQVTNKNLKTDDDVPSPCIRSYHRNVIQEGIRALSDTDVERREFISTTLSIRQSELPKLKREMRRFRDLIMQMTSENGSPDEVYQLNLQLFPLSKPRRNN